MRYGFLVEAGAIWGWGNQHPVDPTVNDGSSLICVSAEMVPLIGGLFSRYEQRYEWSSDADFRAGYQAVAELQEQLFMGLGCIEQIVESNQQIYRLLDTSLNGTQYAVVGGVITPEIPAVPPASVEALNAMRAHIGRIWLLLENEVAGATATAGEGILGSPALEDDQTGRQLLRRLLVGVDGNGTPAPGDNLLTALRGTTEAGADRNVVDKIVQLDTLLAEIRDLLV